MASSSEPAAERSRPISGIAATTAADVAKNVEHMSIAEVVAMYSSLSRESTRLTSDIRDAQANSGSGAADKDLAVAGAATVMIAPRLLAIEMIAEPLARRLGELWQHHRSEVGDSSAIDAALSTLTFTLPASSFSSTAATSSASSTAATSSASSTAATSSSSSSSSSSPTDMPATRTFVGTVRQESVVDAPGVSPPSAVTSDPGVSASARMLDSPSELATLPPQVDFLDRRRRENKESLAVMTRVFGNLAQASTWLRVSLEALREKVNKLEQAPDHAERRRIVATMYGVGRSGDGDAKESSE